jgi:hypothetical protein
VDADLLELGGEPLDFVDGYTTALVFSLPHPDKPRGNGTGATNLDRDVKYDVTVAVFGEVCFMVEELGASGG